MFDIAWTELMVIAVLAIIVVGPKDLPRLMRTLGRWARKARAMAAEFRASLDEIARETELDEVSKAVRGVKDFSPKSAVKKAIDPEGSFDRPFLGEESGAAKAGKSPKKPASGDGSSQPSKAAADKPPKPDKKKPKAKDS